MRKILSALKMTMGGPPEDNRLRAPKKHGTLTTVSADTCVLAPKDLRKTPLVGVFRLRCAKTALRFITGPVSSLRRSSQYVSENCLPVPCVASIFAHLTVFIVRVMIR